MKILEKINLFILFDIRDVVKILEWFAYITIFLFLVATGFFVIANLFFMFYRTFFVLSLFGIFAVIETKFGKFFGLLGFGVLYSFLSVLISNILNIFINSNEGFILKTIAFLGTKIPEVYKYNQLLDYLEIYNLFFKFQNLSLISILDLIIFVIGMVFLIIIFFKKPEPKTNTNTIAL
tara:strand:- start:490 stop:1023 length:534 start_codon:yes stop_codon:yes gene_type:complete